MTEWKQGDRVKMRAPDRYTYALRRLGDRPATVESVFVPAGSTRTVVRVAFDTAAAKARPRVEFFDPSELVAADQSPGEVP